MLVWHNAKPKVYCNVTFKVGVLDDRSAEKGTSNEEVTFGVNKVTVTLAK